MAKSTIKKILITAGPTREMLDPVRFISNLSTGEMGYTLAEIAKKKGYRVTLITGPTALKPPKNIKVISILSAADLKRAAKKEFKKHDALFMTSAVCDFTAKTPKSKKIQRSKGMSLRLKQTSDIVASLAERKGRRIVIGFCLETSDWLRKAKKKLERKGLDGIVANSYTAKHNPFGNRKITTALLDPTGKTLVLKGVSKRQISGRLLTWMESLSRRRK